MNENKTTEFSFMLKCGEYGIGVFAAHDIAKGTYLRLFGSDENEKDVIRIMEKESIPEAFRDYPVAKENGNMMCPDDFGKMSVGWFMNHSNEPNACHTNFNWYALRDINKGEEIVINYNSLKEPEAEKEEFYSS